MQGEQPINWLCIGPKSGGCTTHLVPVYEGEYRPHQTDRNTCWCNYTIEVKCFDCDEEEFPNSSCWNCGGKRWIDGSPQDNAPMIVHHENTAGLATHRKGIAS